jgi:hypothetical protein
VPEWDIRVSVDTLKFYQSAGLVFLSVGRHSDLKCVVFGCLVCFGRFGLVFIVVGA